MILRAIVLLLLLWALPARADATYDAFATSLSPTNYWPLSANPNDSVGGVNGVCTPTCSYGNAIATHVSGLTPNSSGYVGFTSVALTNASGWTFGFWLKTSSSANQVILNTSSAVGGGVYGMNLIISDAGCTAGTVDVQISNNGSVTEICTTQTINDGAAHLIFVRCYSTQCSVYVDGAVVGQKTYSLGSYAARGYSFANYEPVSVPLLGVMGSVEFWAGGTPLPQGTMSALYTCGTTGSCAAPVGTCPTLPGSLWCETFESYSGGDNINTTAPKASYPFQDAQALGTGIINGGTTCTSGTQLTLPGSHLGDEVIGTPGTVTTCGSIPLGSGFDFGQIISLSGGPNGTMSATASNNGVNNVNLTAFRANAQGNCSLSGTALNVSGTSAGAFGVGQFLSTNDGTITQGTYIVSANGGGSYTVNVSQTATPTSPCVGSLWGILNGPNARIFNSYSYAGSQSVGVGTTGTATLFGRAFTVALQEGYIVEWFYGWPGTKTNWDNSGPGVGNVGATGAFANGIQLYFYSNSGAANTMDALYGSTLGCTMTGSPVAFTPATWHEVVLAWRSAADASGYVKVFIDNLTTPVASATGNNQMSPCNMPATLNTAALVSQGSAASPPAEWFGDNIGVYAGRFGASANGTGPAMILQ